MRFCVAALVCCACVWLPCAPAQALRVVYAVTIGNNQPPASEDGLSPLRYADDDAIRYYELFSRASPHVQLLTVFDPATQRRHSALGPSALAPTLHNLQLALSRFSTAMDADRRRGDEPVLLLTYSGHGSTDEQGRYFLAFLDGALTQELLYDQILGALPSTEVHLIVDACNAGGVVGMRGGFDREDEAATVPLTDADTASMVRANSLSRFPFVGALVATSSGYEAHEWSRIEAGVFTHEVISALMGGADVNGDLRVEYSEVEAFVAAANRSVSDPRAVPRLLAQAPAANPHAVLMDLRSLRDTLWLTGTAQDFGRFTLRMPDGRRIGDANVSGSSRLAFALPKRSGMYIEKSGLEAEVPSDRAVVSLAQLQFRAADSSARGPMDRTLRDELFASPYTRDYYSGFVDSKGIPTVDLSVQPFALLQVSAAPSAPSAGSKVLQRDDRASEAAPEWLPMGLLVASGVAIVAAGVTAGLALDAKSDFDDTQLQRKASELRNNVQTYSLISGIAATVGVISGVAAWLTWPESEDGSPRAGVGVSGRF